MMRTVGGITILVALSLLLWVLSTAVLMDGPNADIKGSAVASGVIVLLLDLIVIGIYLVL
jgi:hypothetical protein